MNRLRNQLLEEITHLDIQNLIRLQNLLPSLKNIRTMSQNKPGTGAMMAMQALENISGDLSKTIIEDREERL